MGRTSRAAERETLAEKMSEAYKDISNWSMRRMRRGYPERLRVCELWEW
ncbi:MAG: hypothetical protein ABSA46_14010 [Thermodesulfovibrionales bacterium]